MKPFTSIPAAAARGIAVAITSALLTASAAHAQGAGEWQELARETASGSASTTIHPVGIDQRFRAVMLCAEGGTVRLRRMEVRLDGRVWQRLDVPQILQHGQCTDPLDLRGGNRRIHAVRFAFERLNPGEQAGTAVASGSNH